MVLEQKFRDECLEILNDVTNTRWFDYFIEKSIWKYENELDFVYGVKSGMMMGGIHALFLHRQDKKLIPGDEDTLEVIKIVKSLIPEIKSSSKQSANLQ